MYLFHFAFYFKKVLSWIISHILHLIKLNYDVVKRWVNEAQEVVSSDNTMVQVRNNNNNNNNNKLNDQILIELI